LGGFYKLYTKRLEKEIRSGEMPKHIAIILDGNRRWAKRNLIQKVEGHFRGADAVEKLLDWCEELNIKIITLYVLSAENLSRQDEEITNLYNLINTRLNKLYNDPRLHKNHMKIKAIGSVDLLPDFLRKILGKLEDTTKNYEDHYLNIAIAYGGQDELVDAIKKIAFKIKEGSLDVDQIDKGVIESCLYTSHLPQSSPDMILRTSGEKRLSGFLIWQSAYSELVFMDVYWPEFRKIDLMRAIRTFQKRVRRIGR
jgi:tritrans,polycis-undecaprenyl-diphosphate synthase [geranylgeranyl-diphosphate specific]